MSRAPRRPPIFPRRGIARSYGRWGCSYWIRSPLTTGRDLRFALVVRAGGLPGSSANPIVLGARIEVGEEFRAREVPAFACLVGRLATAACRVSWSSHTTNTRAACEPTRASIAWAFCSCRPTCDPRSRTSLIPPLAPRSDESMPMKPIATDREIRIPVYTTPPADRTRDWVSFSDPSSLPLTTRAVACPLRCSLRNPRPSDATMCSAPRRLAKLASTTDCSPDAPFASGSDATRAS